MKPSSIKALGWSVLCLSIPGLVLNSVLYADAVTRARYGNAFLTLVILSSFFVLSGAVMLVRAYRMESRSTEKPLQLHLSDLLSVSLFSAFLLTAIDSLWLHWALLLYVPALTLGLLLTSRRNLPNFTYRFLHGLGMGAWMAGCLGLGGSVFIVVEIMLLDYQPVNMVLKDLFVEFFISRSDSRNAVEIVLTITVRSFIALLPTGVALCALIRALSPKNSYKENV